MYLKQIEIVGFKSFADKSKLLLSPGITGVVGPNGSGKSNIADAIRWVLGEQSVKNLRGSKMEDVIFAGSELRRSTNLCEVSLVLDNEDRHLPVVFDEVTITRRVFRSGESEYMINRQPCRLKDIHELFMDTGLGREAYSIIGQGKIEEMLSTRAEDRRGPFEDAAGIVKFKHRRKEAERKLDETQANMLRVEDILAELEEQIGPLTAEKEKAEQYRTYSDALEEADITLLVVEIDRLNQRYQQVAKDMELQQARRDEAAAESGETEALWHQARRELEQHVQQLEIMQQTYVQSIEARQKRQGELALAEQEIAHLQETEASRKRAQEQSHAELQTILEQLETLSGSIQHAEAQLQLKSAELEVASVGANESRKIALNREIEELNTDYIQVNHQAAGLRNEIKMLHEQVQTDASKRQRYEADEQKWRTQMDEANRQIEALDAEVQSLETRMEEIAEQIRVADAQYEHAAASEAQTVSSLHRVQTELQTLTARIDLLKDLEEGYDGYALGVRTVMQQAKRGRLQGVYGSMAELIRVAKEYETAIETALGGSMQNVAVEAEADARAAIQLLKQRQAGRATFMPLQVIQSRRLRESEVRNLIGQAGYVGLASDLISVEPQFKVAVEHLLGNVIIADSLEHANALARTMNYRVRVVTLQGDVVAPGGLMSGGHQSRKGPGLLGRSRERQDAEARLRELQETETDLRSQQVTYRSQVEEAQAMRKHARNLLGEAVTSKQSIESKRQQFEYLIRNADERLAALDWEFGQLETGSDLFAKRLSDTTTQLANAEHKLIELEQSLKTKRQALVEVEQEQVVMQDKLTGLRIEVATLRQERQTVHQRIDDLQKRKARIEETLTAWSAELAQMAVRYERLADQKRVAEEVVASLLADVESHQSNLDHARQHRLELEASVRQIEQTVTARRQKIAQADELLHRAAVAVERADADLAHALAKMGEAHGMTYEWAKARYPLEGTPEELKQQVQRLRRLITELGDVNLGAIEEHARLSERVNFLSQQRDDLVSAQEKLEGLIHEIDTEMASRFMETFAQIQREFAKSFEILFNGGEANLQLTNPDDPLTTGIDVIAKPPGKRLQNLNLLSGGERALTAMALLFAILRVRPVPFCVLDEVEAALDEANVSRFAGQLRTFATETQFIVITHRRGTMEEADALYGVTMPERGVSSMVSVRLSEEVDFETA